MAGREKRTPERLLVCSGVYLLTSLKAGIAILSLQ